MRHKSWSWILILIFPQDSFQSDGNSGSKAGFWGWHLPCASSLRCEYLGLLDMNKYFKYSPRYYCFLPKLLSFVGIKSREIKHSKEWFLPRLPRSWNGRNQECWEGTLKAISPNFKASGTSHLDLGCLNCPNSQHFTGNSPFTRICVKGTHWCQRDKVTLVGQTETKRKRAQGQLLINKSPSKFPLMSPVFSEKN